MANSGYMVDMKIAKGEVGEGKLTVFGMAVEAGVRRVAYLEDWVHEMN